MIDIERLSEQDKGRWVEYISPPKNKENGRIKSWNEKFVFVVYKCDDKWDNYTEYTACATQPEHLNFIKEPEKELGL